MTRLLLAFNIWSCGYHSLKLVFDERASWLAFVAAFVGSLAIGVLWAAINVEGDDE